LVSIGLERSLLMSVAKRLFSGSVAGWASIAILTINQLALVPIFLKYWTVDEFAVWLAVQAVLSFGTVFSVGYNTYLEYEFIKHGEKNRIRIAEILYSGMPFVFILAACETSIVYFSIKKGWANSLFDAGGDLPAWLFNDASSLVLVQSIGYLISVCVLGAIQRAIVPFGYYSRNAWLYVCGSVVSTLGAVCSVVMGGGVLETGIAQAVVYFIFSLVAAYYLINILKKEALLPRKFSPHYGLRSLLPSSALAVKTMFGMLQQQGVRLLLGGFLGMHELASFASMRTINNVSMQAASTVVNPLAPELMRYANSGDSQKLHSTFGLMWILVAVSLAFVLVPLQWIAPIVFKTWTLGRISYDPFVFCELSVALLVFCVSQPALAIVKGTNSIRTQLAATICGASVLIASIYCLSKSIGLLSAGLGLMVSEVIALIFYTVSAKRWVTGNAMTWPDVLFRRIVVVCGISAVGMFLTAAFPNHALIFTSAIWLCELVMMPFVWWELPAVLKERFIGIRRRVFSAEIT
jgi:O-antigen/teichoic acid export membrane protein